MTRKPFLRKYRMRALGFIVLLGIGASIGVSRFTHPANINLVAGDQVCTQIAGACTSSTGQCVSFTDGCQRSERCAVPYRECDSRQPVTQPVPPAGCYYQQVQCVRAPCNPILVCQSPTPRPSCAPRPACLDGNPACMVAMPEQGWCPASSPRPTPTPIPTPTCQTGVASLKLSNRCGATGFMTYDFSCESGKVGQINSGSCLEAGSIYDTVRSVCTNVCVGDER